MAREKTMIEKWRDWRLDEAIENETSLPFEVIGKNSLMIKGKKLSGDTHEINVPSAQVKSGLLLASLFTNDQSEIIEKEITRNHTEIMLESFNADITIKRINQNNHILIKGNKELTPKEAVKDSKIVLMHLKDI